MAAPSSLHAVDGGNHSLEVGRRALGARSGTPEDVDLRIVEAIERFLAGLGAQGVSGRAP